MSEYSECILVTGDVVKDIAIYRGDRYKPSDIGTVNPHLTISLGGARQLFELIEATMGPDQVQFAFGSLSEKERMAFPEEFSVHTLWELQEGGLKKNHRDQSNKIPAGKTWRASEALGYALVSKEKPCNPPLEKVVREEQKPPVVLVIDDAGLGFRSSRTKVRGLWPNGVQRNDPAQPKWILHKMSYPVAQGDLWRELIYHPSGENDLCRENLIVVLSGDELRVAGAAISRGFSWERTLSELYRELAENIDFLPLLQQARYLIVNFGCVGAVLFENYRKQTPREILNSGRLIYDPTLAEGQWKYLMQDSRCPVYGVMNTFAAAIAVHLLAFHREEKSIPNRSNEPPKDLSIGIRRGLTGIRLLRLHGHGTQKEKKPGFPYAIVAQGIRPPDITRKENDPSKMLKTVPMDGSGRDEKLTPGRNPEVAEYGYQVVDCPYDSMIDPEIWTLVSLTETPYSPGQPLFGLAHCYALYGEKAIWHIPHARFGGLLSVDRLEMETLRSLRRMIEAYARDDKARRPLCLAAFGPPGAGKSYGIIQIADEILGENGKGAEILTFNLSQYHDENALIGAFHQVRDKVLQGYLPIVFWDEFDSQNFRWLQYLLSPMQDGAFQEDQLIHTLGKCIFVFAGATSWDFENFGPVPQPAKGSDEWNQRQDLYLKKPEIQKKAEELQAEFRLKKGPDFISRLDGHINVLGPNPRMLYDYNECSWTKADLSDVTWPVRRAILLRNYLCLKKDDLLPMDRDLLRAFLIGPRYVFGARSLEKISRPLVGSPKPYSRAYLPPPQVLEQHLESVKQFDDIYTGNRLFRDPEKLWLIAAAILENYRQLDNRRKNGSRAPLSKEEFVKAMANEDAWARATNLAAAARIPKVLALAGLQVEMGLYEDDSERNRVMDQLLHPHHLNNMAEEEHSLWIAFHRENNWGCVDPDFVEHLSEENRHKEIQQAKKEKCLHTLLIPFEDLSDEDKDKDYFTIVHYQEMLDLVGYKITFMK